MADLKHDLTVLVSVAKLDSVLTEFRGELSRLPEKLNRAEKVLATVAEAEQKSVADFETKEKERRSLEVELQDNEARITKFQGDLMQAKTNKEYQACQSEIKNLKGEIDSREERLLVLMDELDGHKADHEADLKKFAEDKEEKTGVIDTLKQRQAFLTGEIERLDNEKPVFLREIDAPLRKKYERLLDNLGHLPATRVEGGGCGGCGAKLPPQLVVEIRENDKLLTCQACGRMLIYYVD